MTLSIHRPGLVAAAGALLLTLSAAGLGSGGRAVLLGIDDAIGPATSDYLVRGIEAANDTGADLVVINLDTPGGLDTAMRDIIKAILSSDVPVVTYVSPGGSRAASAGTYILYASHVAAMAPATNLGAATPVQIGGAPGPSPGPAQPDANDGGSTDDEDAGTGEEPSDTNAGDDIAPPGTASERKAVNDAVAYIRSLAERRGRNADWAEQAVRAGVSLSANDALAENVIDIVAEDLPDLLRQLDGREISVGGKTVTLATSDLELERVEPDWRVKLLSVITNPNVAYLLMLIGVYGLLLEGYSPGAIVPGVVGAICLLLGLYALQVLPVNYAGLGLIALGILLMTAEMFAPSFGALGLGGIVAFIVGSVILFDTGVPGFDVSRSLIGAIAAVGAFLTMALVWILMRVRRRPVVSGMEQMLGATGEAINDFEDSGTVFVHGERWNATAHQPVHRGQKVRITHIDGLELTVEPLPAAKE